MGHVYESYLKSQVNGIAGENNSHNIWRKGLVNEYYNNSIAKANICVYISMYISLWIALFKVTQLKNVC